jgi:acetyl esterase/lipase
MPRLFRWLGAVILSAAHCLSAVVLVAGANPDDRPHPQGFDPAKLGTIERQVTFCTVDGVVLKQDVIYPSRISAPVASVIYVHGGGWTDAWGGPNDPHPDLASLRVVRYLVSRGFVVFPVYFRSSPQVQFPTHIRDLKCAIRSLRANAGRYGIDPNRIGVLGESSGGHLAALMGLADSSAGWDTGPYLGFSSRPQAVVDVAGPSDLSGPIPPQYVELSRAVFGTADQGDPIFRASSPVTYVSPDDPPFLLIHGERDSVVLPKHSKALYNRLHAAGVPSTLIVVRNGGHVLLWSDQTRTKPSLEEIFRAISNFFARVLGSPSGADR